jgi:hypothetical protein
VISFTLSAHWIRYQCQTSFDSWDVVRRQNRANQIRLRHGVNLIQMTLRFGLHHKLPDAPVEGVFEDYVGTRASDVFRPTGHLGKVPNIRSSGRDVAA